MVDKDFTYDTRNSSEPAAAKAPLSFDAVARNIENKPPNDRQPASDLLFPKTVAGLPKA
jgi:hypothetical protein